ncbi:MAG: hypothetical protein R6W86_08120 [Marinobacter sp.]|uniref:hypothetical protein n=1 Tax=Marinobacter sp. TaxID=50741 RepID=UPI00396DF3EB
MSKFLQFLVVFVMLASVVLQGGCGPTPPTPPTCPPMGPMAKKVSISDNPTYSSSDGSSIEVFKDTYAYTDPGNVAWCETDKMSISPVDLSSLPHCPYNNCLAAVDVKPDDLKFTSPPNTSNSKPKLRYDLAEHPPTLKQPEECGGSSYCYAVYQLRAGNWKFVGNAGAFMVGSEWFAEAKIIHFSVFALVELPDPTPMTRPQSVGMVITSDFVEDGFNAISVGVLISPERSEELDKAADQRLLRFSGVDPSAPEGDIDQACLALSSVAEQFTCLFPIDTLVELELAEDGQAVLRALDRGYGMSFFVSDVQIY